MFVERLSRCEIFVSGGGSARRRRNAAAGSGDDGETEQQILKSRQTDATAEE